MSRRTLVIASGNAGKLAEFEQMLTPHGYRIRPQSDFGVEPPEETGTTFVENALIKARVAAEAADGPALGDDSGLVVEALDGRPGIRSARFAGEDAGDDDNIDKLIEELDDLPAERRGAFFFCCLVLLKNARDPAPLIATGRWHGYILTERRGQGGFGYDPVFHDLNMDATAAELPEGEKNRISHRGKALEELIGLIDDD